MASRMAVQMRDDMAANFLLALIIITPLLSEVVSAKFKYYVANISTICLDYSACTNQSLGHSVSSADPTHSPLFITCSILDVNIPQHQGFSAKTIASLKYIYYYFR
jgi:hypothetical protein